MDIVTSPTPELVASCRNWSTDQLWNAALKSLALLESIDHIPFEQRAQQVAHSLLEIIFQCQLCIEREWIRGDSYVLLVV